MKHAVFLLLVFGLFSCKSNELKHGYIRKRKVDSFGQIRDLKSGCLLVMLHTHQNKIDALLKIGKPAKSARVQKFQTEKNKAIIRTFHKQFNFCLVYFFMNSQANELVGKGIDSVTFVNDSLQPDPAIRPTSQKYFVAEFTTMQMDTGMYFGGYRLSTQDSGAWRKPYYYSTSTYGYQAFIFESPQLIQLKRPFKYFVTITEIDRKIFLLNSVVRKSNRRLHRFLSRANKKITTPRFSPYFLDHSNIK
ncbi:MAG: hypothetical protein ABI763_17515 [Bacteroidota bacterium]